MTADTEAMSPDEFVEIAASIRQQVERVIVGQGELLRGVLTCIICGGHALLEGLPGLGKTATVRALSAALDLEFNRIQFTPDLMPSDITGTNIIQEDEHGRREFRFQQGPVFANLVLADEVNRATPKTQSALLEAMQERGVTVAGVRHTLPSPFFVLATQNPLDMEGTYPLPEAQLDRFMLKLVVPFPEVEDLVRILARTTGGDEADIGRAADAATLARMSVLVRRVPVAPHVLEYASRLVLMTHPEYPGATQQVRRFVRFGASPRGAQSLVLAAKVEALLAGRYNASIEDVNAIALAALRHRIILTYEGEAEGVDSETLIAALMETALERAGSM